jgi:hypothetical protein
MRLGVRLALAAVEDMVEVGCVEDELVALGEEEVGVIDTPH